MQRHTKMEDRLIEQLLERRRLAVQTFKQKVDDHLSFYGDLSAAIFKRKILGQADVTQLERINMMGSTGRAGSKVVEELRKLTLDSGLNPGHVYLDGKPIGKDLEDVEA